MSRSPRLKDIQTQYDVSPRDVKNIRTCGYPRIKPTMGRKRILKIDTRYPRVRVFLIPAY